MYLIKLAKWKLIMEACNVVNIVGYWQTGTKMNWFQKTRLILTFWSGGENIDTILTTKIRIFYSTIHFRYYFQEYTPATAKTPASHKHLHHWVFLIDAQVNDYEEDNANYGTESVGKIVAHLQAKDMGLEDLTNHTDEGDAPPVPRNFTKITPLVMTPHCHAPSCIRQEFWNADTNEIICNMTAMYGK